VIKVIEITYHCEFDFDARGFTNAAIQGQIQQATKLARAIEYVDVKELTDAKARELDEAQLAIAMGELTAAIERLRTEGRADYARGK